MHWRIAVVAVAGWLVGIVTAYAVPTVLYETKTISEVDPINRRSNLAAVYEAPSQGWVLISSTGDFYTFQRPRLRF